MSHSAFQSRLLHRSRTPLLWPNPPDVALAPPTAVAQTDPHCPATYSKRCRMFAPGILPLHPVPAPLRLGSRKSWLPSPLSSPPEYESSSHPEIHPSVEAHLVAEVAPPLWLVAATQPPPHSCAALPMHLRRHGPYALRSSRKSRCGSAPRSPPLLAQRASAPPDGTRLCLLPHSTLPSRSPASGPGGKTPPLHFLQW